MNERIWNQRMLGLTFNVEDGRITIFRSTLEALGWPTHYRFLYNREAKQVAVQNCTAEDAGAHKTPKLTVSNSCEIKCVALVRMIYRDMRWNRNNTYRLEGKNVPRQQLVSFDLDIPFLVENGKALDENPSPTKPLCGEELSAAESSSASPIIVLLNSVYTYVTSFDFDKFVADFSLTDFTVSDTTVINNYAPYNTANVSQDFISQAESLNGLEDIGNIYLWTSKQPLSENDLARLQELSASSSDIANELENYRVRQEHGVNVYGLDDFPAEYVQVLDGELNTEQWKAGTGVYVTPLRMMGDGSLCLYKPGDQISVTQLDGTNKVYDVLAVVSIPSALQTPLQVDMGLDYIFPTNELLGNMVSADQPAMKTIFNVDEEHQLATENWLKNYTTNTDTALDYLSKVTLRQTFDGMINMYRLVGGALCAILALIGILNFINSMTTSILSRYREIAMLQSVGMTGRQVKQMLIYEGIGYSILGLLGSLILSVIASLTVVRMMGAELTYFTWHFTLLPVFLCIIPLILITAIVPLVCYNKMAQKTVVERLRIAE